MLTASIPGCGRLRLMPRAWVRPERVRLESLRYATVPEAAEYLAIMRRSPAISPGLPV